ELPVEDGNNETHWLIKEGEKYPLENDKKLSELLGNGNELQYFEDESEGINLLLISKNNEKTSKEVVSINMDNCQNEDIFELYLNLEIDEILTITVKNLTKDITLKKNISF